MSKIIINENPFEEPGHHCGLGPEFALSCAMTFRLRLNSQVQTGSLTSCPLFGGFRLCLFDDRLLWQIVLSQGLLLRPAAVVLRKPHPLQGRHVLHSGGVVQLKALLRGFASWLGPGEPLDLGRWLCKCVENCWLHTFVCRQLSCLKNHFSVNPSPPPPPTQLQAL
jgi:hypothetical protein